MQKTPKEDMRFQLIEHTKVLFKNDKLIIPASLQHRTVSWYHHCLQHTSHSRLKDTMIFMMYWKGMHNTVWSYVKSCRSCQRNKRTEQLRKLGNSLETTLTSLTKIGIFTHHKQMQSSVAVVTTERAYSPSRAMDEPGKFTAHKIGAVKWLSAKFVDHTPTGLGCIAILLFAGG
jgi:hypothetical protein